MGKLKEDEYELFIRDDFCPYLTVKDLTQSADGYFWYHGHYFTDLESAYEDYKQRLKHL